LHATRLAAAANPLLRPLVRVVSTSIERWADEDAARDIGDRRLAARALARAALLTSGRAGPSGALAVADHAVVHRVRALLAPPAQRRRGRIALAALAALLCWATTAAIVLWTHGLLDAAENLYLSH